MTLDRKEAEHLIGAVAAELADTAPNPMVPEDWGRGWDAAVKEHAEPMAEQLNAALAEIDALTERQQKHLQLIANLSQSTPLQSELEGWEGQRAALLAEVGSLRARVADLERQLAHAADVDGLVKVIGDAHHACMRNQWLGVPSVQRVIAEAIRAHVLGEAFDP